MQDHTPTPASAPRPHRDADGPAPGRPAQRRNARRAGRLLTGTAALSLICAAAVPLAHAEMATAPDTAAPGTAGTMLTPEGSFSEIVKQARPGVVTITTERDASAAQVQGQFRGQGQGGPGEMPFDEFFRRFFGPGGPGGPGGMGPTPQAPAPEGQVAHALGSGFIVDPAGLIVTNHHVIDQATRIEVLLDDGSKLPATLVGSDPKTDLAVLKVEADHDLPALQWGDSDGMEAGDRIIAIGDPFGVGTTVTAGIVSARGRDLHNGPYDDFLQIDAALNHGNSGGPVLDVHGRVIGISDAIYSPNDGNVGVGFAIPSNLAQKIVSELHEAGRIERGYLGVQIQPVSDEIAGALDLDGTRGALVAEVEPGSPADKAGLHPADVILSVEGQDVAGPRELSGAVADLDPGTEATFGIWRDKAEMDVPVTLAALPGDESTATPASAPGVGRDIPELGFSVAQPTPELQARYGLSETDEGVVVTGLDEGAERGTDGSDIRPGDVILSVDRQTVTTPGDVARDVASAAEAQRPSVLMLIERGGNRLFVAAPLMQG